MERSGSIRIKASDRDKRSKIRASQRKKNLKLCLVFAFVNTKSMTALRINKGDMRFVQFFFYKILS